MLDKQNDTVKAQADLLLTKLERTENYSALKVYVTCVRHGDEFRRPIFLTMLKWSLLVRLCGGAARTVTLGTYLFPRC